MTKENINQKFRLKNTDETRNYFTEENKTKFISKRYKKFRRVLSYIENLPILVSIITGWISLSTFASLVGITSSAVELKFCVITAGIKIY